MIYEPQPVTLSLETVTPIFVGSGDEIKPLSFISQGRQVYLLDEGRFFAGLSAEARQLYLSWIDPLISRIEQLEGQIAQARRARNDHERQRLQRELRQQEDQLALERFFKARMPEAPMLRLVETIGCVTYQVETEARLDRNGFKAGLKDAQHRPYVPGTELKGALRTALLSDMLAVPENYQVLRQAVERFQPEVAGSRPSRGQVRREIPKITKKVEAQLLRGSQDDAKFDLLRMVRVGDSSPLAATDLLLEQSQSVGTNRFTGAVLETTRAGVSAEFRLEVVEDQPEWLQKLGLAGQAEWATLRRLLAACYRRAQLVLQAEQVYFDANGHRELAQRAAGLLALNRPEQPLLRLGGGQGFLSITADLWLQQQEPEMYEVVREGVSVQRKWRTQPDNFPKTRRLIWRSARPAELLGWIRLVPPAEVQASLATGVAPLVLPEPAPARPKPAPPAPKQAGGGRQTGRVKWFNETKGYGFIKPDEGHKDLFVHISEVEGPPLQPDEPVSFVVGPGKKGPQAQNVRREA